MVDLNELYGLNAIKQLMEKDEFSCIRRTYFLLYQSLIPNCKMTIAILRQHCEITSDVEKYILNRGSARLCCQQLLNFLLVRLDKSKDYMEFCRFLQLTSVLSNLSAKMISEFQKSIFWDFTVPLCLKSESELKVSHGVKYVENTNAVGSQSDKPTYQTINCDIDETITFHCLSARYYCEASEDKANNVSDILINRRIINQSCKPCVDFGCSTPPLHKDLAWIKVHYNRILECLPDNYEATLEILQDNFTDESIVAVLSCDDIREANRMMLDCLVNSVKSKKDVLNLCDQLEKIHGATNLLDILIQLRQKLPASSTPEIQPQLNGQRDNSTVATIQPPSGDATSFEATLKHFRTDSEKNKRPTLRDVYRHVVPNYAHKWRYLGNQLQFSQAELDIIFSNFRNDSEDCCRNLMSRWLNKSSNATWDQLLTAIDNLPQQSTVSEFTSTIKFQQPPVLPPNYIPRDELLEELVSAVMSTEVERNRFGSTVTIKGVGGFGKSVLAKALCHHDIIKAKFKSGFVFVELGPKSFDPVVELHQLYYLLTGKEFPTSQSNTTNIVKEVRQVTIHHSDKLLIIIDDVWYVEDAEPLVEAFNNCKTIITTRKNEISQQIPSKCSITAGPMEPHEAISLLIDGVVLQTQLIENDRTSLDNIAHDVHLWPLLLSLVRGQLSHYTTQHLPLNEAIKLVHQKLYAKGLTAFDRNNVGSNIRNRKNAVKACIETTLDLLQKSDSDKMKVIILFSGIGCAVPTVVLHVIWKTSSLEANDTMSVLWGHGLVTYGSSVVPCFGIHQRHIEVHATISQFIIETMQSEEVMQLTPYLNLDTAVPSFASAVYEEFLSCYGSPKLTSLSDKEYLKYHLDQLEYFAIPYQLRYANMWAIFDPHMVNYTVLQPMFKVFTTISFTNFNLSTIMSSFSSQVTALISDCQKVIRDICRSKKTLYQLSMKHLVEKNYNDLLQELEDYHKQYPIGAITEKSVRLVNDFMAYCQGNYKIHSICKEFLAGLKLVTAPYHLNNLVVFPMIRMYIDHCKRIRNSLHSNSAERRQTVEYFKSDEWEEDMELIKINYQIKIQEVAPNFMHTLLAKLKSME